METITNGETIDGKLDTRTKDARENDGVAPTKSAGDPACSSCGGAGVTRKREGMWLVSTPCACARRRQLAEAIQRCWPADVIKAARFKPASSILVGKTTESLWIRAEREVLAAHLARALPELGKIELVRIASDADLATAWLARAGDRVRDDEVREAMSRDDEDRFERLVDLAAPPALLIVQLGVRISKLDHLSDLVLESIEVRRQRGRPTWVVDTDARPLAYGHRAYRQDLAALLAGWPQVRLPSAHDVGQAANLSAAPAAPAAPPQHVQEARTPNAPNALVEEELARGTWTPDRYDDRGNAWGRCPHCGASDKYSVFTMTKVMPGVKPRALHKCHACGPPKDDGKQHSGKQHSGKQGGISRSSAYRVLIDNLRIGAPESPEVARQELEALAPLRSLEEAKKRLKAEGIHIQSRRGEDGRFYWRVVS